MNIQELTVALEYSREQLFQAEKRLNETIEPELIDAAVYELKTWEIRFGYYNRKLKEAVKSGQAIPCRGYIHFGGRR
jgi:hypothetical protein